MTVRFLITFELLLTLLCGTAVLGEELKPLQETEQGTEQETETPVIDRSSHHHAHFVTSHHEDTTPQGYWKKSITWRPRWVKTWQAKKIYVAVWKKMWGPAVLKEWVPVPKPPPGWLKQSHGRYFIKGR